VRLFRRHDERTLVAQHAMKDDEAKLIASTRESAQQLEQLFEADQQEGTNPSEPAGATTIGR
jgi:hypothetical protein